MLDLSNRPIERIEDPRTDTRLDDPPPMGMRELWEEKPERAQQIFLSVIEGYEYEIWECPTAIMPKLIELMERKANEVQR